MARKPTPNNRNSPNIKPLKNAPSRQSANPTGSTPVRNSAVPKAQSAKREITHDQIAQRAYEIYISGTGGSPEENWLRAEYELRGGL